MSAITGEVHAPICLCNVCALKRCPRIIMGEPCRLPAGHDGIHESDNWTSGGGR